MTAKQIKLHNDNDRAVSRSMTLYAAATSALHVNREDECDAQYGTIFYE